MLFVCSEYQCRVKKVLGNCGKFAESLMEIAAFHQPSMRADIHSSQTSSEAQKLVRSLARSFVWTDFVNCLQISFRFVADRLYSVFFFIFFVSILNSAFAIPLYFPCTYGSQSTGK
jgi:hypothetical protein